MGNSARGRTKSNSRGNRGEGGAKKKSRRRRSDHDENVTFSEDEVIRREELEKGENLMNLTELKTQPVGELVAAAIDVPVVIFAGLVALNIVANVFERAPKKGITFTKYS